MPHPQIVQLRFARSEFKRGLNGILEEDARRRFAPMNCISWNIGHLAWQEQRYWLWRGQNQILVPELNQKFAYGGPPCEPSLDEVWNAWENVTAASDPWLDTLTSDLLCEDHPVKPGDPKRGVFTFGNLVLRTIYHYWYHNGENMAIRQTLGHSSLPEFVGNIDDEAPYRPE